LDDFACGRDRMTTLQAIDVEMVQLAPLAYGRGDRFDLIVGKGIRDINMGLLFR